MRTLTGSEADYSFVENESHHRWVQAWPSSVRREGETNKQLARRRQEQAFNDFWRCEKCGCRRLRLKKKHRREDESYFHYRTRTGGELLNEQPLCKERGRDP